MSYSGPTIEIAGASRARRVKRRFDAVITIEDPGLPPSRRVRFHRVPHPDHLVLIFEDLDEPHPPIITATIEHVEAAISFARERPAASLLVHCHAGIGRSPAIALAIIADRLGSGFEPEALGELLRLRPMAVPNLLAIKHADAALDRNGKLLALVEEWDGRHPRNRQRRALNRQAILDAYPSLRRKHGPARLNDSFGADRVALKGPLSSDIEFDF
ncbi:hypothetical protein GCM10011611_61030 [Aliidongia dinghuensis]|uniref:Tyrosine specific protein phosphatases domain-containing protein n=1 Tax=Aliidongia dinghuensis TaxID=1867774 RepID=A0A8J2YZH9_9PROT|nr:dual specificity protein phosphatase family protein [Aliidongia dinghuensis]GGF46342.1 hypothetical protein GCM10011611_61030 [Aliidongia dinghuensis]